MNTDLVCVLDDTLRICKKGKYKKGHKTVSLKLSEKEMKN